MQDILIDNAYDLVIENGDFVIDESTNQHQHLLLITQPGEWKMNPTFGIGIENYLLDDGNLMRDLTKTVRKQFELDGMKVDYVKYNGKELKVDASYE